MILFSRNIRYIIFVSQYQTIDIQIPVLVIVLGF